MTRSGESDSQRGRGGIRRRPASQGVATHHAHRRSALKHLVQGVAHGVVVNGAQHGDVNVVGQARIPGPGVSAGIRGGLVAAAGEPHIELFGPIQACSVGVDGHARVGREDQGASGSQVSGQVLGDGASEDHQAIQVGARAQGGCVFAQVQALDAAVSQWPVRGEDLSEFGLGGDLPSAGAACCRHGRHGRHCRSWPRALVPGEAIDQRADARRPPAATFLGVGPLR